MNINELKNKLEKIKKHKKDLTLNNDIKELVLIIKENFFKEENQKEWENLVNILKEASNISPNIVRETLKYEFKLNKKINLEDYKKILKEKLGKEGEDIVENLILIGNTLKKEGKNKIIIINATFQGGGVAEMLETAGYILKEVGIELEWHIVYPFTPHFYNITKTIHNTIQGKDTILTNKDFEIWEQVNKINFEILKNVFEDKKIAHIFIEDPQVAPLIKYIKESFPDIPVTWRKHIDIRGIKKKNKGALLIWEKLKGYFSYLNSYDTLLFQPNHVPDDILNNKICVFTQYPGIDPLKHKNINDSELPNIIEEINTKYNVNINFNKPMIITGSRFDYWKGLAIILKVFSRLANIFKDIDLILFGNYANDDPEGKSYYELIKKMIEILSLKNRVHLIAANLNKKHLGALYKLGSYHKLVFCALSLAEGYCLMTNEASIQKCAVFTSDVGGLKRYSFSDIFCVNIEELAYKIEDASELYKIENNKIKVNNKIIQEIEEKVYNKLYNILKLRKENLESYNKIYSEFTLKNEKDTYKKSLISMLINYLTLSLNNRKLLKEVYNKYNLCSLDIYSQEVIKNLKNKI